MASFSYNTCNQGHNQNTIWNNPPPVFGDYWSQLPPPLHQIPSNSPWSNQPFSWSGGGNPNGQAEVSILRPPIYYQPTPPQSQNSCSFHVPPQMKPYSSSKDVCSKKQKRKRNAPMSSNNASIVLEKNMKDEYDIFCKLLDKFLIDPQPAPLLHRIMGQLELCSKNALCTRFIVEYFKTAIESPKLTPYLLIRTFWLLGEMYKKEYELSLFSIRSLMGGNVIFSNFLKIRKKDVRKTFIPELQAIFNFWKAVVPKQVMDGIYIPEGWNTQNTGPSYASMDLFYRGTNAHTRGYSKGDKKRLRKFDEKQKTNPSTHNHKKVDAVAKLISQGPHKIVSASSCDKFSDQNIISPELEIIKKKVNLFTTKLDKLLTIDHNVEVPKATSEVMYIFLLYGTDERLCEEFIRLLKCCIVREESMAGRKTFMTSKIIRILWIIGYIFCPANSRKVIAAKLKLEKIAPQLFWICLKRITEDNMAREEMRVILRFWQDVMDRSIISEILNHLRDSVSTDSGRNYSWVLDDKNIKRDTRITEFYTNSYLLKSPCPKSKDEHATKIKTVTLPLDTDVQRVHPGPGTNVQRVHPGTDVQCLHSGTDVQRVHPDTDVQRVHSGTDVQRDHSGTDVQRVHPDTDVQRVHSGTDVQRDHSGTDAQRVHPDTDGSRNVPNPDIVPLTEIKQSSDETEIIALDKRDIIKQNKNWETSEYTKLTDSKNSSSNHHGSKKKTKKRQKAESLNLFTDFLRIPSRKPTETHDHSTGGIRGTFSSCTPSTLSSANAKLNGETPSSNFHMWSSLSSSFSGEKSSSQPTISKLELFRKKMQKDQAITSLNYNWGDSTNTTLDYLPLDWSVSTFVDQVFSDDVLNFDIVKLPNGETRVKLVRK